jgi:hypothetical protein
VATTKMMDTAVVKLPVVSSVQDRNGVTWLRLGECNRCGACCKSGDPYGGTVPQGPVAGACPLYTENAGIGTCTNREDYYYSNACAHWPSLPAHIVNYPLCSYTFEQVG